MGGLLELNGDCRLRIFQNGTKNGGKFLKISHGSKIQRKDKKCIAKTKLNHFLVSDYLIGSISWVVTVPSCCDFWRTNTNTSRYFPVSSQNQLHDIQICTFLNFTQTSHIHWTNSICFILRRRNIMSHDGHTISENVRIGQMLNWRT